MELAHIGLAMEGIEFVLILVILAKLFGMI
jgi:hypothetical protein